jgi:hypothetical protein
MRTARTYRTAVVGAFASALATALVLAVPWHWLAMVGALLLASVPAGAAIMSWIDSGEASAQAALVLTLSLTAFALAGALMIWLAAWHPRALLALAGVSAISCLERLRRGG